MSFNAEVYTDLAVRAEQRVELMDQAIANVKKNGYQKKAAVKKQFTMGALESGAVVGNMLSSIVGDTIPQKRKSTRQRTSPKAGDATTASNPNESQKPLGRVSKAHQGGNLSLFICRLRI